MREFQLDGLNWMISLYETGINGILADEMGLGKTIQILSYFDVLKEIDTEYCFLVICPASVMYEWVAQSERFGFNNDIIIYHGSHRKKVSKVKNNLTQT